MKIVAEYAGKVEGEGGENVGSSTASYEEGEPRGAILWNQMLQAITEIRPIVGVIGTIVGTISGIIAILKFFKRSKKVGDSD